MKKRLASVFYLLLLLAACQPAPQAGPFAIYLLDQPLTAVQADSLGLEKATLQPQPVLSADDLISYDPLTHQMRLTAQAYARLNQLKVPVFGLPFVVCVGSERVYAGAFWAPYSSLSYDGIVIQLMPGAPGDSLKIEPGYPSASFFQRADPRADRRVMDSLRAAGKLK